jgi:hypothetical protein
MSYKQKNKFLPKERAMKKIIILAMALVMMLVSIGGCWPWGHEDGNGDRHEKDAGYDRGGVPGGPEGSAGPRGHVGPGGAGGGH